MESSNRIFCIALLGLLSVISFANGQVLFRELPPEMQKVFNETDFDHWSPPDDVKENFPYYLSGYDYENRPIWVLELGRWPVRAFIEKGGEEMDRILTQHVNQILWNFYTNWGKLTNSDGERVNELNVIIDMKGYSLRELGYLPAVNFLIKQMRLVTLVAKFSQFTGFLNTNFFGETILNMIKPVMGKSFERFEVYGTNPKTWQPKLLKLFPRDQLPPWYGGSKEHKPVKVFG